VAAARACEARLAKQSKLHELLEHLRGIDTRQFDTCRYIHSGVLRQRTSGDAAAADGGGGGGDGVRSKPITLWLFDDRLVMTSSS
jgi:hypothetical protein